MTRWSMCLVIGIGLVASGCEVREAPSESAAEANAPQTSDETPGPVTGEGSEAPLAIAAASADLKWGPCPPGMPEGCQIAVLHGDPAKPNSDILLKVPAGASIAPHWHSSAERMMLVGGQLAVKNQGAAETSLLPGTYAYGPAKLPHRADCRSSEPCTLFIAFEGSVDRHPYDGQL